MGTSSPSSAGTPPAMCSRRLGRRCSRRSKATTRGALLCASRRCRTSSRASRATWSYDPRGGTFRAWLFRIASNAGIDRIRREAVRSGPELDAPVTEDGGRRIDFVAGEEPGPEREGASRLLGRDLATALQTLPETQRAAVLLRHQQGYSFREIATALGMREVSARTAVHRGLKRLREELGEWADA